MINESMLECCASGCYRTASEPGIQFIKLPEDHKQRSMILKSLGRDDLLEMPTSILKKYIVCSRHFATEGTVEESPSGDTELEYQTQSPIHTSSSLKFKSSKSRERYSPYELSKNQNIQQMKQNINPLGAIKVEVHKQDEFYPGSSNMQENLGEVDLEIIGRHDHCSLCEKCGRLFPSLRELYKHQAAADSVTDLENFKTNSQNKVKTVSEQPFPNSSSQYLVPPMSVHPESQGELPVDYHSCTKCQKYFKNKTSLKKHIETFHGDLAYCSACGKVFKSKYYLYKHQTEHCSKRSLYN